MRDCTHRERRLVIDLPAYTYQIQCRDCLLTGDGASNGMRAWMAWMRLMRAEAEELAA